MSLTVRTRVGVILEVRFVVTVFASTRRRVRLTLHELYMLHFKGGTLRDAYCSPLASG